MRRLVSVLSSLQCRTARESNNAVLSYVWCEHERGEITIKVLELFAGFKSVGKTFESRGHDVYAIDWDDSFADIDKCADILTVTAQDIIEDFGQPDVIWASPDCTTYSVAAISHHRVKNPETGSLDPISDYARKCDATNKHVIDLIKELNPKVYFIENPRGGCERWTSCRTCLDIP